MKYDTIRYSIMVVILFIVQRLFNCFVYKTDGISVLFGICLLAFAFILHWYIKDCFEKIYYKRQTKKYRKMIDKRMSELEDMFKDDSK